MSVVIIKGTEKTVIAENVSLSVARDTKLDFIASATEFAIVRILIN